MTKTIDNRLLRIFMGSAAIIALATATLASSMAIGGPLPLTETKPISLAAPGTDAHGSHNLVPIAKLKNVALSEQAAEDRNVEFSVAKDKARPYLLVIEAKNKSTTSETNVQGDRWLLWMQDLKTGEKTTEPRDVTSSIAAKKIPPGKALVIATIDLQDHAYLFEERPSTYQITLEGSKVVEESSSKALGSGIQGSGIGMETVYLVRADIDVGYDALAIKNNPNKILRMSNMEVKFDSTNFPHSIKANDKEPKQMIFYTINNGDNPSNALRKVDRVFLINLDNPEASVTMGEISEQISDSCLLLKPGEKKEIGRLDLGAGKFPLQNLMNKLAGEDEFTGTALVEGTYILKLQTATADCKMTNGQKVAGGLHETVLAFDVAGGE